MEKRLVLLRAKKSGTTIVTMESPNICECGQHKVRYLVLGKIIERCVSCRK